MYINALRLPRQSFVFAETTSENDEEGDLSTSDPSPSDPTTQVSSSTTTEIAPPGDEKRWVLPLAIGLGVLLLVLGVAALVIVYRKWKCFGLPLPFARRKLKLARPMKKLTDSVRSSISSTFSNSGKSVRGGSHKQFNKYAVRLDKLVEGEGKVEADGGVVNGLNWIKEKDFSGEFEAVKRADLKDIPTTAALKTENVLRNRFSNVLPYDSTRVVLTEGAPGNDYVNASYVTGFRKEREFICTQGPLKQTVADFWQMCWETKAVAIVMLTKCYESNQEKCYPYWPSGNTGYSTFGDITVTLEKKTVWRLAESCGDAGEQASRKDHLWLVSELLMEKEEAEASKKIIHIVFLSWPDFGVVDPPCSLVTFIRHVQELVESRITGSDKDQEWGPVVVHCSAGVGRSGVFIAVDQLIKQLDSLGKDTPNKEIESQRVGNNAINIFQIVVKMRRERMGMVQNLMQYTLIYKCLQAIVKTSADDDGGKSRKPSIVSADAIQGSDWGLVCPDA